MISCEQHDYIEIACMYRLNIRLTLDNDQIVEGQARDVKLDEQRRECIILQCSSGNLTGQAVNKDKGQEHETWIALDRLIVLEALDANPHFDRVALK